MNDLRQVLFDTLSDLRDKEKPMDIDRAKAISEVAGRLIESAKVECQYLDLVGGDAASGFIQTVKMPPEPPKLNEYQRHRQLAGEPRK
jgi:hypothetical protein